MSGRNGGRASRPKHPEKPLIYAFCEGKSEAQYLKQLKKRFEKVAVIRVKAGPNDEGFKTQLFKEAVSQFEKTPSLQNDAEVTDEIWLVFDTNDTDGGEKNWDFILKKMNKLRKKKPKPGIRVRLLMTTGCLEYWLLLHFRKCLPSIQCKAERDRVENELNQLCLKKWNLAYEKGNPNVICLIFDNGLDTAVENGKSYLKELEKDGLPPLDNPSEPDNHQLDSRYQWLLSSQATFTTVQEAITALRERKPIT